MNGWIALKIFDFNKKKKILRKSICFVRYILIDLQLDSSWMFLFIEKYQKHDKTWLKLIR